MKFAKIWTRKNAIQYLFLVSPMMILHCHTLYILFGSERVPIQAYILHQLLTVTEE